MKTPSYISVPRISVARPIPVTGSWFAPIVRLSGIVVANVGHLHERARQRRQLSELNDRLLADIGVSRIDACHESSKHFWQA